jgi:thioredoxin reductase (NADPH)
VLPDFEGRVKDGDIRVIWNSRVVRIGPDFAYLSSTSGEVVLPAQHVYLMTGYTPHPGLLTSLAVAIDPVTGVPAHDPVTMETTAKGIFIAGVLASGYDANKIFIENGRGHGVLIAKALKTA